MKNNRFFISFVGPSIALKVSTKVLALPPKESLSNCLKWLGDLGDGSGFATWKWNNMENHLRPPGKMHVGDGAWLEWLSGFGVGTHFSQRHKGEFDWSCTMFYCNFTILYHNVSCTWVLPFQMFLKNLHKHTNFNKSHGVPRSPPHHRISEWWTSGDDFGMAHAFALWSRPCWGVSTGLKFWDGRSVHQSLTHYWSPWSPMLT